MICSWMLFLAKKRCSFIGGSCGGRQSRPKFQVSRGRLFEEDFQLRITCWFMASPLDKGMVLVRCALVRWSLPIICYSLARLPCSFGKPYHYGLVSQFNLPQQHVIIMLSLLNPKRARLKRKSSGWFSKLHSGRFEKSSMD